MTADNILSDLGLTPAEVPNLPAEHRNSLISHLIRWEHHEAAGRCLHQLLVTHSHLVSIYDSLARVLVAEGDGSRALEIMRRRHALRVSNSSRALEARAHLAAGNLLAAKEIAKQLTEEHPDLVSGWSLQADVCLAAGEVEAAETAARKREALRPDTAATAAQMARLWQARGDTERALLWARVALGRSERDGRVPALDVQRLLETLYRSTGQAAQAVAMATQLAEQERLEQEELRRALAQAPDEPKVIQPRPEPAADRLSSMPVQAYQPPTEGSAAMPRALEVLAGGVDLSEEEKRRLEQALHDKFPHDAYRPGQVDVIAAVLRGESVLAVMPTGAGKSLCYQLAATELPGTTLVISPLIALMKDQLDGLPESVADQATTLNSSLDGVELGARLNRAARGGYQLLYAAPERLRQRPFLHALKRAGVSLLVVDEAHCVSLWGHDFRPDYHFIAKAWQELGQPPILGMTATATPRVRDDIQTALGRMRLISTDVHRPNLRLEARQFANNRQKNLALLALCQQIKGSGIVYATARRKCEELALMLQRSGVEAIYYHAGIRDRAAAQDRFMNGDARVVVATIAFGMGIDKADVRFVIHYNPPKTLESYYQEAGRAGRDGLPSRCVLFHSRADRASLTRWIHQDALEAGFLRDVYSALNRRLGAGTPGLVAVGDLERDLTADDTKVRVAVHFLERAGLVWRGFDLPRTASLTLCRPVDDEEPELARFVETAHLRLGQRVSRNLLAVSRELHADVRDIEAKVLAWQDAGWLRYHGTGRDMLLALPQAPADSRQRVAAMLAAFRAGQEGRLGEIMAYAKTRSCRHGRISAYFGGRTIDRCEACDNCLGIGRADVPERRTKCPAQSVPKEDIATPAADLVLQGVAQLPYPLGRSGLVRAMQGATSSSVQADRFALFGALSGWTQAAIHDLVVKMEDEGLLTDFEKSGYRLLRLSRKGRARLRDQPEPTSTPAPAAAPPAGSKATKAVKRQAPASQTEFLDEHDEALFERLRAWRLETARTIGKPPFVVFHDSTLKQIAATCPADLEELADIKGIGPVKLERYGESVLVVVRGQGNN